MYGITLPPLLAAPFCPEKRVHTDATSPSVVRKPKKREYMCVSVCQLCVENHSALLAAWRHMRGPTGRGFYYHLMASRAREGCCVRRDARIHACSRRRDQANGKTRILRGIWQQSREQYMCMFSRFYFRSRASSSSASLSSSSPDFV